MPLPMCNDLYRTDSTRIAVQYQNTELHDTLVSSFANNATLMGGQAAHKVRASEERNRSDGAAAPPEDPNEELELIVIRLP